MSNTIPFPTKNPDLKRINEQNRIDKWHDSYWLAIHKKIIQDREKLRQKGQQAYAITVGVEEYQTLISVYSRRERRFTLPREYCKIPIVLIPMTNLCAVVPRCDLYWHEFIEEDK